MRRSLRFRFASALLAVRFAVLVVQPNGMHMMTMDASAATRAENPAADDMAGMAGMPDTGGHDTAPAKQDHSNDCARHDCCCVTAAVLVPQGASLAWVPVELFHPELLPPVERAPLPAGEYFIPFAIGPPGTLAG